MNIVLHGNGKEIRMHRTDVDQLQHKITVPTKVFSRQNKWVTPASVDVSLVYRFAYEDGNYFHYQLDHVTSKQS